MGPKSVINKIIQYCKHVFLLKNVSKTIITGYKQCNSGLIRQPLLLVFRYTAAMPAGEIFFPEEFRPSHYLVW